VAFSSWLGEGNELGEAPYTKNYVTLAVVPVTLFSRGIVTIVLNNKLEDPIVDLN